METYIRKKYVNLSMLKSASVTYIVVCVLSSRQTFITFSIARLIPSGTLEGTRCKHRVVVEHRSSHLLSALSTHMHARIQSWGTNTNICTSSKSTARIYTLLFYRFKSLNWHCDWPSVRSGNKNKNNNKIARIWSTLSFFVIICDDGKVYSDEYCHTAWHRHHRDMNLDYFGIAGVFK